MDIGAAVGNMKKDGEALDFHDANKITNKKEGEEGDKDNDNERGEIVVVHATQLSSSHSSAWMDDGDNESSVEPIESGKTSGMIADDYTSSGKKYGKFSVGTGKLPWHHCKLQ